MASLPNQTENVPLLNNSTEQHSENLTLELSPQNRNDLGTFEERRLNDTFQPIFPDETSWSVVRIVGGFIIAGELAIAHYVFLRYLHGRDIDEYPQVWIKGANNGFSNVFSIFLGLSASSALTQIKWRASHSKSLRMYMVDNLFALPAPLALLKTLMRPRSSLFFPIMSSVLIHALLLVNVLAPSALTVAPSQEVSQEIDVPIFNLTSQAQFAAPTYTTVSNDFVLRTLGLSILGQERISSVLLNLPELTWATPRECGLKCAFYFEYDAPGLECHDIIHDGFPDPPGAGPDSNTIYQANTNLYPLSIVTAPSGESHVDAPYDLSIYYTTTKTHVVGNITLSPRAGTYCRFYKATYNASFELNSNSSMQRASTSVISHGDYLSWGNIATEIALDNVQKEGVASWAICYGFASAFLAIYSLNSAGTLTRDHPILASIFDINITASTNSFNLAVSNLSQHLVNLFSNLTVGLVSIRGGPDTIIANATIWGGSSIWISTTWILWAAYLPAVILAIIVAFYGLYTIHESGIAMDDKFSTFLLATQDAELSEICKKAAAFDELQRLQLIYQNKGMFKVVDSDIKSPN